jgi:hypothetical protein
MPLDSTTIDLCLGFTVCKAKKPRKPLLPLVFRGVVILVVFLQIGVFFDQFNDLSRHGYF